MSVERHATAIEDMTEEAIKNLQYVCDEFNDFDGKAMIVLYDCDGEIECIAGQNDSYNSNDIVIITKNLKESKEWFVTPAEIQDLLEQRFTELND